MDLEEHAATVRQLLLHKPCIHGHGGSYTSRPANVSVCRHGEQAYCSRVTPQALVTHVSKLLCMEVLMPGDLLLNHAEGHGSLNELVVGCSDGWEGLCDRFVEHILHRDVPQHAHVAAGLVHPVEHV